ncbi:unnamed protein product [Sphagnum troendelagicum]|uniref:Uncharacterized protein n=1 Tax=Sphagnum troendelagicum TaxID=128251 RepID=A0ABP0UCA7_9BRYO
MGCCHPKRDTTNRVTSSAKIPSPIILPPSLSHKETGEEGRGHGWMVKSVVVVGGGGRWGRKWVVESNLVVVVGGGGGGVGGEGGRGGEKE